MFWMVGVCLACDFAQAVNTDLSIMIVHSHLVHSTELTFNHHDCLRYMQARMIGRMHTFLLWA